MRQSYRTDLSDEQWELLEDMIPPAKPIHYAKVCRNIIGVES
jgi:transposase